MKYEITYKCGHTGTVELFGKGTDREYRLARLAEKFTKMLNDYAKEIGLS